MSLQAFGAISRAYEGESPESYMRLPPNAEAKLLACGIGPIQALGAAAVGYRGQPTRGLVGVWQVRSAQGTSELHVIRSDVREGSGVSVMVVAEKDTVRTEDYLLLPGVVPYRDIIIPNNTAVPVIDDVPYEPFDLAAGTMPVES